MVLESFLNLYLVMFLKLITFTDIHFVIETRLQNKRYFQIASKITSSRKVITISCWWAGYESEGSSRKLTIRDQLAQLVADRDGDFSLPLGKNLKKVSAKFLTISQKRNIRRQAYLNEVSQRNDSVFFATVGAFVILPPLVILGIAILTGYVQLFPWKCLGLGNSDRIDSPFTKHRSYR